MDILKRLRNKVWVAAFLSFVLLTLKMLGVITVPENIESWVDAGLTLLTATGVLMDPTTPGIGDDMMK